MNCHIYLQYWSLLRISLGRLILQKNVLGCLRPQNGQIAQSDGNVCALSIFQLRPATALASTALPM